MEDHASVSIATANVIVVDESSDRYIRSSAGLTSSISISTLVSTSFVDRKHDSL